MAIHFKFKSAMTYDSIPVSGVAIRIWDLKEAIVHKKNMTRGLDFNLVLTNAQTNESKSGDHHERCAL